MTFKTSDVTTRMGVRDAAYKLGKLAELLTLGHGPVDSGLATQIDALSAQMQSALVAAGYAAPEPQGSARVTNNDAVTVAAGSKTAPAKAAVTGNTLGNLTLSTATDALVSDGDALSIQDRSNNTLLGSGVSARVSANKLVSAYFSALTYAISSDGNPMNVQTARGGNVTTGRVRLYVANNVLTNVYLDATAALQTGNTVPVQNSAGLNIQPGTVTVTNNLVASVKLPANYTAFGNGISHNIVDAAGKTASAVANVANGSLTNQTLVATAALALNGDSLDVKDMSGLDVAAALTVAAGVPTATLPGTNAIVHDAQILTVTGGSVMLAVANGAITATYTAS